MSVLHRLLIKHNLRRSFLTSKFSFPLPSDIDSPAFTSPPAFRALTWASLSFKAFSSILTYFFKLLLLASLFLVLPSSRAILPFISCLSISQPFRSRSCLCHSVCRKRITPRKADYQHLDHQSVREDLRQTLKRILRSLRLIVLLLAIAIPIAAAVGARPYATRQGLPGHRDLTVQGTGASVWRRPLHSSHLSWSSRWAFVGVGASGQGIQSQGSKNNEAIRRRALSWSLFCSWPRVGMVKLRETCSSRN
jgi:hypothetical protein